MAAMDLDSVRNALPDVVDKKASRFDVPAGAIPEKDLFSPKDPTAVSKAYHELSPEIKELVNNVLDLWRTSHYEDLEEVLSRFVPNMIFDSPLFFLRGKERVHIISKFMKLFFHKIEAEPQQVTVRMVNEKVGQIIIEGVLRLYPLLSTMAPFSIVAPRFLPIFTSWSTMIKGDDDKVLEVRTRFHNILELPRIVKALLGTYVTTIGFLFTNW